jgi:protein-arginine kinase activator protein McsA
MIICDRCQTLAVDQIIFKMDDQRFDVCESCKQEILENITKKSLQKVIEEKSLRGRRRHAE